MGFSRIVVGLGLIFWQGLFAQSAAPASETTQAETPSRIYIPVGQALIKKVLLAVEPTRGAAPMAAEFQEVLLSDLSFTDFFESLPQGKVAPSPGMQVGSFSFDPYKAQGVAFLIKSSVQTKGDTVEAEVRLYDVSRGGQILGRLYPFLSKQGQAARELAHYAANDIVESLTGERGVFRTRILASCGKRRKEIQIMDFDGANIRALTDDKNLALSPSWAPDGRRMLFTSYKPAVRGGFVNPNLYLYDVFTKERKVLSAAKGLNTGGSFHPKENKIAYTFSTNGRPELFILDLETKTRKAITSTQFFTVEPDWSPDGSQLTYSSSQTGRPHIFVSKADGTASKRLTFAGVYNSSPNWSPRGDKIVFSGQENMKNNFNIFTIDPSGSNLQRLTDGNWSSENPVFSPDGRHIAFSSNRDGNYRIYTMTVFGTNLKPITPASLGDCKQPAWSPRM